MKRIGKLRSELLLQLHSRHSVTVTELARRTERHRSSVSRALTAMKRDGWVDRVDGYLALTVNGVVVALEADDCIRHEIHEAKRRTGDLEAILMRRGRVRGGNDA